MCIVSAIGDDFSRRVPADWFPGSSTPFPGETFPPKVNGPVAVGFPTISQKEFEALRKEVEDLRHLLEKAKAYDEEHNEPNCELEEKISLIRKFGEIFSIDFRGIFDNDVEPEQIVEKKFERYRVVDETGEVARFDDLVLAHKFADYVAEYTKNKNVAIIEIEHYDVDTLKYGVTLNKNLIAVFLDEQSAKDYIEDRKDRTFLLKSLFNENVHEDFKLIYI